MGLNLVAVEFGFVGSHPNRYVSIPNLVPNSYDASPDLHAHKISSVQLLISGNEYAAAYSTPITAPNPACDK